jgi:transcriptional regulator with XRE-family HTH domain
MVNPEEPDWYLQAWASERGKKQTDLVSELGWHKTTAHRLWHGLQPYRRDFLNAAARWLGVQPHELLMPPGEALALRQLRESAVQIADQSRPFDHQQPARRATPRTGTGG